MKSLNEDLKTGNFKQIYLLYGEEDYLKHQYRDRFVKALVADGDTMNYAYYEGKNTDVKQVIDLAETLPFFSERRLIVLENTGFFKSAGSDLADYIPEMPETTYFVFVEKEVDKRSRLYKAVKAKGHIVEMGVQDEETLRKWVLGRLKQEKKQMSGADAAYFIRKVGTGMDCITKELEKLICYTMDREWITREDIDILCVTRIEDHIFDMVNAVAKKEQKKALNLYYDLLTLKISPMKILFLMTREYRLLFHVKGLMSQGFAKKDIASRVGLAPFAAGKYMDGSRSFSFAELRSIMEEGVQLEQNVKTGLINEQLAVELFIVKHSRG